MGHASHSPPCAWSGSTATAIHGRTPLFDSSPPPFSLSLPFTPFSSYANVARRLLHRQPCPISQCTLYSHLSGSRTTPWTTTSSSPPTFRARRARTPSAAQSCRRAETPTKHHVVPLNTPQLGPLVPKSCAPSPLAPVLPRLELPRSHPHRP